MDRGILGRNRKTDWSFSHELRPDISIVPKATSRRMRTSSKIPALAQAWAVWSKPTWDLDARCARFDKPSATSTHLTLLLRRYSRAIPSDSLVLFSHTFKGLHSDLCKKNHLSMQQFIPHSVVAEHAAIPFELPSNSFHNWLLYQMLGCFFHRYNKITNSGGIQ